MASNRFAALSPDFEEEEAKRQYAVEQKAKKEALKIKQEEPAKVERKPEASSQSHTAGPYTRGRGSGRPYRGRGGYSRGGATAYAQKDRTDPKATQDYHFTGNNDPNHPFDRHSGTGRGTEVSKYGAGRRNWGRPEDDYKNLERVEGEEKALSPEKTVVPEEQVKAAEQKPVEAEDNMPLSKREKKLRKKDAKKEEKEEEPMDVDGKALTYTQYQAMVAEKQKALPSKKPVEVQVTRDPKAAGLVAYEKPHENMIMITKKKVVEETKEEPTEKKADILGAYFGEDANRAPRRTWQKEEVKTEAPAHAEGERHAEGEEWPRRGRGGFRGPKRGANLGRTEEKKAEHTPFVMKDDEFPELK